MRATLVVLIVGAALVIFLDPSSSSHEYRDSFDTPLNLREAPNEAESGSPEWWLSSGGYFTVQNGVARTVIGSLEDNDERRMAYARTNPTDTDDGYHPQNLFRFVKRGLWGDAEQQVTFRIVRYRESESENRNASNGVFLMHRYQDADNLYYLGLRVDGYAVIKKKKDGVYHTLAYEKVLDLPLERWVVLKGVVVESDRGLSLSLYSDVAHPGVMGLVAEALDQDGLGLGRAGIRTDFMDVEFDEYVITERLSPLEE